MKKSICYILVVLFVSLQLVGCGLIRNHRQIAGTDLFADFAKTESIDSWLNNQETVVSNNGEIQKALDILKKSTYKERDVEKDIVGGWTYMMDFITEDGKQHITVRGEHTLDVNGSWYYMNESDYNAFVKWAESQ